MDRQKLSALEIMTNKLLARIVILYEDAQALTAEYGRLVQELQARADAPQPTPGPEGVEG